MTVWLIAVAWLGLMGWALAFLAVAGNRNVVAQLRCERAARRVLEIALRRSEADRLQWKRYADAARIRTAYAVDDAVRAAQQVHADVEAWNRGERA